MKTHVRNLPVYLVALSMTMSAASSAYADWFHRFEFPPPDTFVMGCDPPSVTFSYSTAGGVLTLSDSTPPASGGTSHGSGEETSQVFTDVTVEGTIMPTGSTDNWVGLFARWAEGIGGYWLGFAYGFADPPGTLNLGKDLNGPDVFLATSAATVNPWGSYDLRLTIEGNHLTGELWDFEGGTQLLSVSATDNNAGGVPPFTQGTSGVFAITTSDSNTPLYATFDNVRSVPEPSALLLAATGAFALLAGAGWRWRRTNR